MAKKPSKRKPAAAADSIDAPGETPGGGGKHLVIVESPTKAKTINKYLGRDYLVMASVGHVRDLPSRAPKGTKQLVPGVDLENDFAPSYEVMPDKEKTVTALRKAAKRAADVWFATDLDREGEAIAWHLAQALKVPLSGAKRVVFNAITKGEIQHAFSNPRPIDENKVNAQQARRILDRIVGYQVSPLLWKKVAGGLSAGRVQSVATRLVVEREREIEAFIPEEYWKIAGYFTPDLAQAAALAAEWTAYLKDVPQGENRSLKDRLAWLSRNRCLRAELVEFQGKAFKPDNRDDALKAAQALGFSLTRAHETQDEKGKGPARFVCSYDGALAPQRPGFNIHSIETKRTSSRPPAPFITSTLQQAAANQMGFGLQRAMRIAQQLYEGIDIHGSEGQTGLITYMRTDSTHISGEALNMVRSYISEKLGEKYLPEKPNFFTSSNKSAQEAHEAIRPTDVSITPQRVKRDLTEEQFKLYTLIWERFVACQMTPAQWDSTVVTIVADRETGQVSQDSGHLATFRATGRTLVFDGFYKVLGLPNGGDEAMLPPLKQRQELAPLQIDPTQHFTSPPPRFTEASLQKKLEEEGIGRPSTYAAIITTIQDRKYVQPLNPRDKRLFATDLGKVVTDKLVEAFPQIMDVGYTREMELELDKIEEEHHDWVTMLKQFYGPFRDSLARAHEEMTHAKAEFEPAPYDCSKCGASTVYRFGRNGKFLSCSRYPDCDFAAPIDREGKPMVPQLSDILCPVCGSPMTKRTGRFGPFLSCSSYPQCTGIVKIDPKKHTVVLPKVPPLLSDVPCPKCKSPLNVRESKRGLWLSCSTFPKCRGRVGYESLDEKKQKELQDAWTRHIHDHPAPIVRNTAGDPIPEGYLPRITDESATPEPAAADSDAG